MERLRHSVRLARIVARPDAERLLVEGLGLVVPLQLVVHQVGQQVERVRYLRGDTGGEGGEEVRRGRAVQGTAAQNSSAAQRSSAA